MDPGADSGAEEFRIEDLDKVYVSSLSGKQIPLKQFVELKLQQVPSSISRFDMERTAEILADIETGYTLDEVINPVIQKLEQYVMPTGYTYKISGELESRDESFGGMTNAVLIAVISIFSVLVLQFRLSISQIHLDERCPFTWPVFREMGVARVEEP